MSGGLVSYEHQCLGGMLVMLPGCDDCKAFPVPSSTGASCVTSCDCLSCDSTCPGFDGFPPNAKGLRMVEAAGIEPPQERHNSATLSEQKPSTTHTDQRACEELLDTFLTDFIQDDYTFLRFHMERARQAIEAAETFSAAGLFDDAGIPTTSWQPPSTIDLWGASLLNRYSRTSRPPQTRDVRIG